MTALKFSLHPVDMGDGGLLYALRSVDSGAPDAEMLAVLGTEVDVARAAAVLARFVRTGRAGGATLDHLDERLGARWVTVPEAVALAAELGWPISAPVVRRAAAAGAIRGAARDGRDWRMPQARFLAWLRDPRARQRGRRPGAG